MLVGAKTLTARDGAKLLALPVPVANIVVDALRHGSPRDAAILAIKNRPSPQLQGATWTSG